MWPSLITYSHWTWAFAWSRAGGIDPLKLLPENCLMKPVNSGEDLPMFPNFFACFNVELSTSYSQNTRWLQLLSCLSTYVTYIPSSPDDSFNSGREPLKPQFLKSLQFPSRLNKSTARCHKSYLLIPMLDQLSVIQLMKSLATRGDQRTMHDSEDWEGRRFSQILKVGQSTEIWKGSLQFRIVFQISVSNMKVSWFRRSEKNQKKIQTFTLSYILDM